MKEVAKKKGQFYNTLANHPPPTIFKKGGGGEDLERSKEKMETGEKRFSLE